MGTLRVIYEAEDGRPVVIEGVGMCLGDESGLLHFRGDDGAVVASARAGRVVEVRDMTEGGMRGGHCRAHWGAAR